MRVIAGTARGRRLAVPPGLAVRPTADRVRESLFSSIAAHLRGADVLDLYAGSGSLGIEALSRGAGRATFVEADRAAAAVLRSNLDAAGVADRATVHQQRVLAFLRAATDSWTLAFLDPPYSLQQEELAEVLAALSPRLAPGALVVVERDARSEAPSWPAALESAGERAYGSTRLHRAVAGESSHRDEE